MKTLKENLLRNIGVGKTKLINDWLKENTQIEGTCTVNKDYTIDVEGSVSLNTYIVELPEYIQFNKVTKTFDAAKLDKLKTLKGFPKEVRGYLYLDNCFSLKSLDGCPDKVGSFSCAGCRRLKSLEGCPKIVRKDFTCFKCTKLETLKGCPDKVGSFSCAGCKNLASLEGAPKITTKDFDCAGCTSLESLEGCPGDVGGYFSCAGCENLKTLKGCPKKVGGDFSCVNCPQVTSLEGCPEEVGGKFACWYIGYEPTEQEIRSRCDIKGRRSGKGIIL